MLQEEVGDEDGDDDDGGDVADEEDRQAEGHGPVKAAGGEFVTQVVLGELPAGEDGEAVLGDFIESDEPTPDALCELEDRNKLLIKAVNTVLTPKEKNIIEKRFGLNGSKRMTLLELGESIGLTNERVRQIELGALRKLRRHLEVRSLNDGNAA